MLVSSEAENRKREQKKKVSDGEERRGEEFCSNSSCPIKLVAYIYSLLNHKAGSTGNKLA